MMRKDRIDALCDWLDTVPPHPPFHTRPEFVQFRDLTDEEMRAAGEEMRRRGEAAIAEANALEAEGIALENRHVGENPIGRPVKELEPAKVREAWEIFPTSFQSQGIDWLREWTVINGLLQFRRFRDDDGELFLLVEPILLAQHGPSGTVNRLKARQLIAQLEEDETLALAVQVLSIDRFNRSNGKQGVINADLGGGSVH